MQSRLQTLCILPLVVFSAACIIESPDDDDAVSSATEGDDAGSAGGTDAGSDTSDDSNGSEGSSGDSDSGGSTESAGTGESESTGGGESSGGADSSGEESSGGSDTSGVVTNCAELCGVTGDNDQTACADGYFNDLGYSTDGPACTGYFLTEDQEFCLPCVAEMGASDAECADAHAACF